MNFHYNSGLYNLFRPNNIKGATLLEYCLATVILILCIVSAVFFAEKNVADKVNSAKGIYSEFNIPQPTQ